MKTKFYQKKLFLAFALQLSFSSLLLAQAPTVAAFSPETGNRGTTITITGTNFNATAANNIVYFGATKAVVNAASATQLVVTVPLGATCKPITVLNTATGLSASSIKSFTITLPPYSGYDFAASSFNAAIAGNQGTLLRGIVVADFDGDGKADVAGYTGSTNNSVGVMRNTSTTSAISFAARADFLLPTGASARLLTTGDIDNDGKIDIVIGSTSATTKGLYVFRNASTGAGNINFTRVDFAADNNLNGFAIGDLDGDGKPEIVASNGAGSVLSVYKNSSTPGTLTPASLAKTNFAANTPGCGVAIGDIDGDGRPEILVADHSGTSLSIFRNTIANGTIDANSFAPKVDYDLGTASFHYTVSLGDLDGDGKLDIVVPQGGANTVSVLRNTSTSGAINAGSLAARVDFALNATSFGSEIADMDGDGKLDIVAVSSSKAVVFRNKATSGSLTTGSFAAGVEYAADAGALSSPNAMAIGDINSDGKPDIIPSIPSSPYSFSVLQNNLSTTLPLHMLSVKAYQKAGGIQVEWITTNEYGMEKYEVERSADGQEFRLLGMVTARGDNASPRVYSLLDVAPLGGVNYYRIRSVSKTGEVSYSAVARINTGKAFAITLYPNPIEGNVLIVQLDGLEDGTYSLMLYNTAGQEVLKKVVEHSGGSAVETISLGNRLASGVYQFMLRTNDRIITQQVIKN